jgi:hypothetical protein
MKNRTKVPFLPRPIAVLAMAVLLITAVTWAHALMAVSPLDLDLTAPN